MFSFTTGEKSDAYMKAIVGEMIRLFGISEDEAIGRLNEKWRGLAFTDEEDELIRETPSWWAKNAYFGHDSAWWSMNESELKPLPYPRSSPPTE
jgi:hypothetical protein